MSLIVFKKIGAIYYFKRSQFSHFVAIGGNSRSSMLRALYALGMYQSVLKLSIKNSSLPCEALLAKVASYAACDEPEQVSQLIQLIEKRFPTAIESLIEVLTPFDSRSALTLAQKYNIHSLRVVALLLRHHVIDEAQQVLNRCTLQSEQDKMNFYLLKIQLNHNPFKALEYLNQIYLQQQLLPISKRSETQALSIINLSAQPKKRISSTPLISILMTAYNSENYIASTLNSLLNQSLTNIELIIVDDQSTDETWNIINQYAQKDCRVKPYQQPINAGTYTAKNRALSIAQGEFVVCHDSDDWSHPQRLELQLQPLLSNHKLVATVSNWFRLSDQGEIYSRSIYPLIRLNPSSLFFRRKLVMAKLGFWDTVRTGADSEFLRRVKLQFGHQAIHKVNLPLAIGAHHENSLMNAPDTGFISQKMPLSRLHYWESWNHWHIDALKNKTSLYMKPFLLKHERKFLAPEQLLLDDQVLSQYQNAK